MGNVCPSYVGFLGFSLLHGADFFLRMCSLSVYFYFRLYMSIFCLVPLQVLGTFLSIYITFHDADVLLWMHKQQSALSRFGVAAAAFALFGCCQVIQVKRAWARQLTAAEVLTDMDEDYDDRATTASSLGRFAGAERIMPVALITGVPFLLVNWLYDADCRPESWAMKLIWCTNAVLIATVSLGIAEVDVAVSSYLLKRYHVNPQVDGPRTFCRQIRLQAQRCFWLLHLLFRASEVVVRLMVITGLLIVAQRLLGKELMVLPLVVDYCAGVALLVRHSPDKERTVVHVLAGVALLVCDLGHFVDQPNFAAPARRITQKLMWWRLLSIVILAACLSQKVANRIIFNQDDEYNLLDCKYFSFEEYQFLACAVVVYYLLRFSPPITRLGDDLHTAAKAGDIERVRKLLKQDRNGQVLDVNAMTKDAMGMTPLMLAAANGHIEVMKELLKEGAQINLRNENGDTCLHFAAAQCHVEASQFLMAAGAHSHISNDSGWMPADVVPNRHSRANRARSMELRILLTQAATATVEPTSCDTLASQGEHQAPKVTRYYTVKAAPTAGLQLRTLFPDLEKDDTPSPRVLQSVSALVVSRAAGALARRVLARQDESASSVPLGALRRVRELGRGGFGRVIEVELPMEAAGTFFRRHSTRSAPRRFALKLQLKQDQRQATSEVLALRRADHPFIVHLYRAFSFDKFFALLLELCPTDLNRLLCEPDENGKCLGLSQPRAARYMGQAALALAHLHLNEGIVFRDVKPENILISSRDEAKLTDFGLAKVVTSAERMTMCGTMGFLPPELIGEPASFTASFRGTSVAGSDQGRTSSFQGSDKRVNPFKTDAYSFGVTLQVALLGEDGARRKIVKRKGPMMLPLHQSEAENTELLSNLRDSGRLSPEAFALLVEKLLPHSPARRSCLADPAVLNHPFFLRGLGCTDLEAHLLRRERPADPGSP